MEKTFKYIEIIKYSSGEVVKRIDVSGISQRNIDRIDSGMNRNMNHSEYYTIERASEIAIPEI